jgi:hypothetical protein
MAVVATVAGAVIPILFFPGYYFVNDTEAGAYGQWYEIGRRILDGNWSLLNPTVWQSGNYQAEGAWGIYSPLLWAVGLGSHLLANAALYSTIVKLVCLAIASAGLYVLARTYSVTRTWSAVVATAVPLAGFTLYFDAPSWVNGLMAWAFWPLAVGLSRRVIRTGVGPVGAVLAAVTVVGIGYAAATLMLAAALGALLVEEIVRRRRRETMRALGLAVVAGLFAVLVHLPGVLTSSVSGRSSSIGNDGFLTVDLSDLAISGMPMGSPFMDYYIGNIPGAPITYMSWSLPLLVLIDWSRLWRLLRRRPSLLIIGVAAVAGALAPSEIGPLRYPVRFMPYLTAVVVVVLALGLSRSMRRVLRRRHLHAAWAIVLVNGLMLLSQDPRALKPAVVAMALVGALVLLSYALAVGWRPRRGPAVLGRIADRARATGASRSAAMAVVAVVGTVALLVPQHYRSPQSPLETYDLPSEVSAYGTQLPGAEGDVLVVGFPESSDYAETLLGNSWYVTGKPVQNAYSSVYYPGYGDKVCMQFNGLTCGALYEKLFQPVRGSETGADLVDLIGASTVQVVKARAGTDPLETVPRSAWSDVPAGWSVVEDTPRTRTIVRDVPVAGAGSVAWTSDGTRVTLLHSDPMGSTFRVDAVPEDGGTVALSLIPWPGYQVSGAEMREDAVDGFLLGVDVTAADVGTTVTASFWSPGWPVQFGAALLAALLTAAWAAGRRIGGSRRRRARTTADARAPRAA